ncbi:MAG: WecB/TagA/CpsF family glycosyltransferase [Ardenticatenaceae bacterium]
MNQMNRLKIRSGRGLGAIPITPASARRPFLCFECFDSCADVASRANRVASNKGAQGAQGRRVSLPVPHTIAGVKVHPLRLETVLAWIKQAITERQRTTIMYANAYAINLAQRDPAFLHALNQAEITFCDGYGVRLAAELLKQPLPQRFTPPDWIDDLMALCTEHKYRLFLLGAKPGVAANAAHQIQTRFPQLEIATHHGYFSTHGTQNEAVRNKINAASPHILLVGMGMPRQEIWIEQNRHRHNAPVVIAVGALFDYLAGQIKRGPRWLTDSGGEWLWRLCCEPRRLWRRYLLGNPAFVWLVLREWITKRQEGNRKGLPLQNH